MNRIGEVPGQIWLGDLVRAIAGIAGSGGELDAGTVSAVAAMLGLAGIVSPGPAHRSDRGPEWAERAESGGSAAPTTADDDVIPSAPPVREQDPDPPRDPGIQKQTGRRVSVLRQSFADDPPVGPWSGAEPLRAADPDKLRAPLPHLPLFRPSVAPGILQAALSAPAPDGDVDLALVVRRIAMARAVTTLPRLPRLTLRFGAQLLIDRSRQMFPFFRDQLALIDAVREVVGKTMTDSRYFEGSPILGSGGIPDGPWGPYQPPNPGGRVIVVSGFGIGRGVLAEPDPVEWQRFAALVRRQGAALVALVPFPRHRWPGWLSGLMPVICWDRGTTIGAVRAALGGGAR